MILFRPLPIAIALVPIGLALSACEETIVIGELDPRIVALGPLELVDDALHLYYALNDPAGNDQDLTLEICTSDLSACGPVARPAAQSGGTIGLPTLPAGNDVIHLFAWYPGCGTVIEGEQQAMTLEGTYVARLSLETGAHEVISSPFSLGAGFELTQLPPCP